MTVISDKLEQLFAQIERAWEDRRDRHLVFTLAREYPDYEEELHAFFEDLVLGPLEDEESQKPSVEAQTLHQWLITDGFALAMRGSPASTPTTSSIQTESTQSAAPLVERLPGSQDAGPGEAWISFLRRRLSKPLPSLLDGCADLTFQYLVLVSRQPDIVPTNAKAALAKRVEAALGIPWHESLLYLEQRPQALLDASRKLPHEEPARNFEELLDLSGLAPDAKNYWMSFARAP